ncbi:ATP-binding cassette sub- A member 3 [Chamberlinius hualienensis]
MQQAGPRAAEDSTGGPPGYCDKGFLLLQHTVSMSIGVVINQTADSIQPKIKVMMQRLPYPSYRVDYLGLALKQFLPLILMLSFLYPAFDLVKSLVLEKEKRLKESMKIMGLTGFLHWSSWFTKAFIFFGIDVILVTFLLCNDFGKMAVFISSDASLIFVFLLLYVICGISFCMMLSTFFSSANSAATAGGIIWFLSYMPFFFIGPKYATVSFGVTMLSSLLCNTCMAFGGMLIFMNEGIGYGLQWSRINTPTSPDDQLTMAIVMGMLLFDTFLYLLITWYVDNVYPGEFGMPQPFYFPFKASYWCPHRLDRISGELPNPEAKNEYFENEPNGLKPGISICNLTKLYGKKLAVNQMNLNVYEGQITALLGHNGAGKTTTMSILTGLYPPSQGTAYINGHNIVKDGDRVRSSLGLCPQHDVIFDDLTVEEHFYFSCQLKDVEAKRIQPEIEEMLAATNLIDKRKTLSCKLSGGMKRRLCVGMALVGDSKVVMLDEPTSGMDPTSRRFTWDLLKCQAKDRTILLSTHFMDEADILGAGYHMIIVKKPNCNPEPIKHLITSIIPNAQVESNIGAELSFILPHGNSGRFPSLFSEIEAQKNKLNIASYGASVTTLEEVFIKVGEKHDASLKSRLQSNDNDEKNNYHQLSNEDSSSTTSVSTVSINVSKRRIDKRNKGISLFFQQVKAMVIKKMLHTKRNWILAFVQLILPIIILVLSLLVLRSQPSKFIEPPLTFNLHPFKKTFVTYSSSGENASRLAEVFADQFENTADKALKITAVGQNADMSNYLLKVAANNSYVYERQYMIGGTFYDTPDILYAIAEFNNQPFHTPAIALNFLDISLLRYTTGINDLSLTVINHPLPDTYTEEVSWFVTNGKKKDSSKSSKTTRKRLKMPSTEELVQGVMTGFQIAFNMMFGISFLASSFVIFLVKEKSSDAKHLQFVSGVRAPTYWVANFIWDFLNYIIPCLGIMIVFLAFQQDGYCTLGLQGCLLLTFVLYGWCGMPFTYLFSFVFNVASTAYARVTMLNIFSGAVALIVIAMLNFVNDNTRAVAKILDWVFMALPNYCLGSAVKDMYINYYNRNFCEEYSHLAMMCVPRGECFGLLGINGAGKTTTFKMLTGDEAVSSGDAYVEGASIRQDITGVRQMLGYCPQFDAVIDQMTGRETLFMFGRLRGVFEGELPGMVSHLSTSLMFAEHIDKLVKNYSGGNRRKLSTAVALIGNPPIVFLDEPTTGMDPLARRMVWDTISRVRDSGSSIILTMEECDVLCTRLAIMVKGRFQCLGSPQHLKNKFGKGYTLTAKIEQTGLSANNVRDLTKRFQAFLSRTFPGCKPKDIHQGMVHYHILSNGMTWGEIFSILEKAKTQFHLEDYSIVNILFENVAAGQLLVIIILKMWLK